MQSHPGCIVVEAEVSRATGRGIRVGSLLPVQFVTESGVTLPLVTGRVVARSPLPAQAAPSRQNTVKLEILLRLRDLARGPID